MSGSFLMRNISAQLYVLIGRRQFGEMILVPVSGTFLVDPAKGERLVETRTLSE